MKRILPALLFAACATAHPAGGVGPAHADLAKPVESDVTVRDAGGVRVIVKRVPHVKLVTVQLYLEGGVRNWTAQDAGVERLALATAVAGGTTDLPKAAFQAKLEQLGSQIASESTEDFAVVEAKGLARTWRPTFDLLADAVLRPALPADEIEEQRQLQLSAIRQEDENPDSLLGKLSHEMLYHGLPYANRAVGTMRSVAALGRTDLVRHLDAIRQRSRLLVVAVGDVDPDEVAAWAKDAFGGLPQGSYRPEPPTPPVFQQPSVNVLALPLPTTYVLAAFPAPNWRSPDLPAAIVAMSALKEKLFDEVRTKRNLSYAPGAGLSLGGLGEGYLYVTAEQPNTTLGVMLDVLHSEAAGKIDPAVLEGDKRVFLTRFLMRDETTDGLASLLGRAEILGGDWRLAARLVDGVEKVGPAQVAAFLKAYARNFQTAVLGDPSRIDRGLFTST